MPSTDFNTPRRARKPQATRDVWRRPFLAALKSSPNISAACIRAGIDRSTAFRARQRDEAFAMQWAEAIDEAVDMLEEAAWQRAMTTSDRLMELLLKAHRPSVYGDRLKLDVRHETRRYAKEIGLTDEETELAVAAAERILREERRGLA
jgi:hypothetical protein